MPIQLEFVEQLVESRIEDAIGWYQAHKRWPRRFHRVSTALVIGSGAAISVLVAVPYSNARVATAILGAAVTALTGLNASYRWERTWRLFAQAQTDLEELLIQWKLDYSLIRHADGSDEEATETVRIAALAVLERARGIRGSELEAFFPANSGVGATQAGRATTRRSAVPQASLSDSLEEA
jgi:hypothetical protein